MFVQDKMTTELSQVLDDEEKRWAQTLHIEEYQSGLARSVIQVIYPQSYMCTSISLLQSSEYGLTLCIPSFGNIGVNIFLYVFICFRGWK